MYSSLFASVSNLPSVIPPIKAFRESALTIHLNMYDGFVEPNDITFELWFNRKKIFDVAGTYSESENRITGTIPSVQIKKVRLIGTLYVRFDADWYVLTSKIKPTIEGTVENTISYNISQSGDVLVAVGVTGQDLIDSIDSRLETIETSPLG